MPAGKGILAGFVATVVLSVCMFAQAMAHWAPALNAVVLLQRLIGGGVIGAWIGYFVIGTLIWGLVFVWLYSRLPGGYGVFRGLVFGVLAWAAMLLLFFPVAGAGFLGAALGWHAVAAALLLHLIYGTVLGMVYAAEQ